MLLESNGLPEVGCIVYAELMAMTAGRSAGVKDGVLASDIAIDG